MPAFTFEKISSRSAISKTIPSKPITKHAAAGASRGLIFKMLDRIAVARMKRDEAQLPAMPLRKPPD